VNKYVFGNNFIGYDPTTYEKSKDPYYGYSDYGAGVWNAGTAAPVSTVINLAKSVKIRALRFPGGGGSAHYDWKDTVGKNRIHFLFGADEFLKTCAQIGADPVMTLSYFIGMKTTRRILWNT